MIDKLLAKMEKYLPKNKTRRGIMGGIIYLSYLLATDYVPALPPIPENWQEILQPVIGGWVLVGVGHKAVKAERASIEAGKTIEGLKAESKSE